MSKIRLSAESLKFYLENKNNKTSQHKNPFVSYVQDEETEEKNDGSISFTKKYTPWLKAYSRRLMNSIENLSSDDPHTEVTSVNLIKRFSNTPDRVIHLALEDKDKVVDQEGRGCDNFPSNDKQIAKENNVKATKSSKTKKNQMGKKSSLNYDSDDAEISEHKIVKEQTKPPITRRRGVKNTTKNAGKTRGGRKLASEAFKSTDEEVASRILDETASVLPDLKRKGGRPRKTPTGATGTNLNVVDKKLGNHSPSRRSVLLSTSNKSTTNSAEQDSDVVNSFESDDDDGIFSIRSSTLKMGTSKSSTILDAFLTPVKNAKMLPSLETSSTKGSSADHQPSNLSDSSALAHRTPRGLSLNLTTIPKGRQTVPKDRITSSNTEKITMRLSPVLSSPKDRSSWTKRTAAIANPVPMVSSPKSPMKLRSAGEKGTPKKTLSKVTSEKTISQNKSLSSNPEENREENRVQPREETSALKRKSLTTATSPLMPNKRQRRSPIESGQRSVNSGMNSSYTEPKKTRQNKTTTNHLITAENRETENSSTDSVVHTRRCHSRFNPYLAPSDDVFCAQSLMSTEEYETNWLHLEPKSVFTLKTFAPTMFLNVSGSIEIKIDETPAIHLKQSSATEIGIGHRCIITNTGNTTAIFETIETLKIS